MRVIHFGGNYSSNLFIECHTSLSPTNVIIEMDQIWNHAGKIWSKLESAPIIDVEEEPKPVMICLTAAAYCFYKTCLCGTILDYTVCQSFAFLDPLSKNERKFGLDGLFLTSAVSWVGVRAKVTGCWNCYKENLAAVLSQPLENNFKLWCEIYWEPQPGNSGRHAHQVNSHFFPQMSALHQWNGTDSNSERAVMCQTPLQKEDYKVLKPKNRPCLCSHKWKKKNLK